MNLRSNSALTPYVEPLQGSLLKSPTLKGYPVISETSESLYSTINPNNVRTYFISEQDNIRYPGIYAYNKGRDWKGQMRGVIHDYLGREIIARSQKSAIIGSIPNDYSKVINNINRLYYLQSLEENWNMNGAKPFDPQLISKAMSVISSLKYQPEVFPTGRNSIQFEFEKQNGDYLEFEIYPEKIDYYFEKGKFEEENSISIGEIPEKVELFYAA